MSSVLKESKQHLNIYDFIHLYSPQTVAQQEKKNEESNSLTKSCTTNNDTD